MPDKIIVREKDHRNPGSPPGFDLADHLLDRFEAHLAAKDDDDVAELAAERTTPRTLHDSMGVTPPHQVQAGWRGVGHVDFLGFHIMIGPPALGIVA